VSFKRYIIKRVILELDKPGKNEEINIVYRQALGEDTLLINRG